MDKTTSYYLKQVLLKQQFELDIVKYNIAKYITNIKYETPSHLQNWLDTNPIGITNEYIHYPYKAANQLKYKAIIIINNNKYGPFEYRENFICQQTKEPKTLRSKIIKDRKLS